MVATDTLHLVWDLTREHPTLGGALVLRQEGELLAVLNGESSVTVHVVGPAFTEPATQRLAEIVFTSSAIRFQLVPGDAAVVEILASVWPSADERRQCGFSYFGFSRIIALHRTHRLAPELRWDAATLARADAARRRFGPRLVCLHLRSVPPFALEESNADGPIWNAFLRSVARPGQCDFLLLGDDPVPTGLQLPAGVFRAADLPIDLATQLALVSRSNAFLGMASGLCTAANLSATPHVIFKHPAHHAAQMQREFGDSDHFSFAHASQRLWRKAATVDLLHEALSLVLP